MDVVAKDERHTNDEVDFDYDAPSSQIECEVKKGEVIFLPNNAVQMNDKLIDKAEFDSCSDRDDLDLIDSVQDEPTAAQLAAEFWKMGIDIDFRFIDKNRFLFQDKEQAAMFTPMVAFGHPVEIPCVVLFDYHSGFTCMDMTVLAGDVVYVAAEEHQVLLVGREDDKEWVEEGNPTGFYRSWKYSLCRREIKTRHLYSSLGLMPSSYLVPTKFYEENEYMFVNNWWWLGICSFDDAFLYLTSESFAQREGLFVIFSPRWLNVHSTDYRSYILMMLTPRAKATKKAMDDFGSLCGTNIFPTHLEQLQNRVNLNALEQLKGHEIPSSYRGEGVPLRRIKKRAQKKAAMIAKKSRKFKKLSINTVTRSTSSRSATTRNRATQIPAFRGNRSDNEGKTVAEKRTQAKKHFVVDENDVVEEPTLEEFVNIGASLYAIQTYAIQRSSLGHYELMDRRYMRIHDLVWDLSHNYSHLPCRLVPNGFSFPPPFPATPMEAPPHDLLTYGLPMNCEQWAAKHCRQATLPKFWNSPVSYVIRSFINPFKDKLWKLAGLTEANIAFNASVFKKQKEKVDLLEDEDAPEEKPFEIPTEEHSTEFDPKIVVPANSLRIDNCKSLGKGQFGDVYLGEIKEKGEWKKCVVKQFYIKQTGKNEEMTAFAEEIDIASAMLHPNVVGFYGMRIISAGSMAEGGEELICFDDEKEEKFSDEDEDRDKEGGDDFPQGKIAGHCFAKALLVIEYCSGGSFDKYLENRKAPLTNNEVIDWMSQVARGLCYLHTRVPTIAHGDVAIRNILMQPHPTDTCRYVVKIADFGLAKFMRPDSARVLHGRFIPWGHLPPETLRRRELSPAADIWSFGCTLGEVYGVKETFCGEDLHVAGITKGYVYMKPDGMPPFIYTLLLMCMRLTPHDRISMDAADKYLRSFWIESDGKYIETVYGRKHG